MSGEGEKRQVCLYLDRALAARAFRVSEETGVSVSHMATKGLLRELRQREAVQVLEGTDAEFGK